MNSMIKISIQNITITTNLKYKINGKSIARKLTKQSIIVFYQLIE